MPPKYIPRPSEGLLSMLEEEVKHQIGRKLISVFKGGVWTTDAPFRETEDKVREYAKRGLCGGEWNVGFGSEGLRRAEKLLVKSALEVLVAL